MQTALGCADDAPNDRLLPVELGAAPAVSGGSHRQNANLTALRSLVNSFVVAHNYLVHRVAENQDVTDQLRQSIEQLQLELKHVRYYTIVISIDIITIKSAFNAIYLCVLSRGIQSELCIE